MDHPNDTPVWQLTDEELAAEAIELAQDERCRIASRALDMLWFNRLHKLQKEWRERLARLAQQQ